MSLETYRTTMHAQFDYTTRAQKNHCRPQTSFDRFTRTPLSTVAPFWRPFHVGYAHARHERAQRQTSVCTARDLGRYLAAKLYGWTGAEFAAIDGVISQESSWDPCAHYPGVHGDCAYIGDSACGIPQAVPCSKLRVTWCHAATLGACSAADQIKWLYRYIAERYGTPTAFAAHKWAYGWI